MNKSSPHASETDKRIANPSPEVARDIAQESNPTHVIDRRHAELCAYDGLEDVGCPKCSAAQVTHTVKFANGTVLQLCERHSRWYREIHPIKIPITPKNR